MNWCTLWELLFVDGYCMLRFKRGQLAEDGWHLWLSVPTLAWSQGDMKRYGITDSPTFNSSTNRNTPILCFFSWKLWHLHKFLKTLTHCILYCHFVEYWVYEPLWTLSIEIQVLFQLAPMLSQTTPTIMSDTTYFGRVISSHLRQLRLKTILNLFFARTRQSFWDTDSLPFCVFFSESY